MAIGRIRFFLNGRIFTELSPSSVVCPCKLNTIQRTLAAKLIVFNQSQ